MECYVKSWSQFKYIYIIFFVYKIFLASSYYYYYYISSDPKYV